MDCLETKLKKWVEDEEMSLGEMYDKCCEEGLCLYLVEREETLRDFIKDMVTEGNTVAPLLASMENNPCAEFYLLDLSSYSDNEATPIYYKKDLMSAILGK